MTQSSLEFDAYRGALNGLILPRFAPDAEGPCMVALEGPNGTGKSTLCELMANRLRAARCLGTDEAWFGPAFKTRMIRDADWYASAMFFLSGCFEQTRVQRSRPDPVIIMDRSLWSTFAVHAALDLEHLEMLIALIRPIAPHIRIPHLTLVLDASFATCQERIAKKQGEARELDALTAREDFHAREREFYRWLARQVPGIVFLDVDRDEPEEVARRAVETFQLHRC